VKATAGLSFNPCFIGVIMNRTYAFALVLATAAVGNAFAGDGEITREPAPFVSTASRAQVLAELAEFRRSGVDFTSYEYNPLKQFHSDKTRAEVRAEYIASRREVAAMNDEASGAVHALRTTPRQSATRLASRPSNMQ
jgi:hypothetical protein